MNLLPRHRCSQKGGHKPALLPIKMPPMIKLITTKPYVFLVLLAFPRIQQTNINTDDQVAWPPSNQTFAIQFKCITRKKLKVFFLKIATLGPHPIIFELNAITIVTIYCTNFKSQSTSPDFHDKILLTKKLARQNAC